MLFLQNGAEPGVSPVADGGMSEKLMRNSCMIESVYLLQTPEEPTCVSRCNEVDVNFTVKSTHFAAVLQCM